MTSKVYIFLIRLYLFILAVQSVSGFLSHIALDTLSKSNCARTRSTSTVTNANDNRINMSNSSNDSSSSSSSPIPPPPSVSMPVYSLASKSEDNRPSMNIVTFTTPVSVKPKLFMVSLYHNTMTKDSFLHSKYGILQLLNKDQKYLVQILGKSSGYDTTDLEDGLNPKEGKCQEKGYAWTTENISFGQSLKEDEGRNAFREIKVLPQCSSYIGLKLMNTMDAGDHVMALCAVVAVGKWDDKQECVIDVDIDSGNNGIDQEKILYSGLLREEGII
ncbi:hypothetical protein CTEN210_11982 [Chaetoceros tenuissimus]|uniref:Flavin reductase like domain-containing protein n=1 Tax=Chaetoceros tenuissimus TaxID=426638 RepID=A0AAD3D2B6_9STRA|nr:hypothetical protein CTEN210_11982 [Chaetoceros tenuissimus]